MKLDITKNAKRSIFVGLFSQIVSLLLPFIVRTIFIRTLGEAYLGLGSLFTSILSVLSLAELGVGTGMVYFMYKPLANDDYDEIRRILNLYKKAYRIIGLVILGLGIVLLPILPFLVEGDVPTNINIYVLYLIELCNTLVTYFFFAYKRSVLDAYQRIDITSAINLFIRIVTAALQILTLVFLKNYYLYVIIVPITSLCSNIITLIIVDKKYPFLKGSIGFPTKEKTKKIKSKIAGLFVIKIGYIVTNSVDNIVISAFLGLAILGKYSNYYYIYTTVFAFISMIYNSFRAGLGNFIANHSKNDTYELYKKMLFLQHWLIIVCTTCFVCLYQPFIELWAGKEMMLSLPIPILLSALFLIDRCCDTISLFKDAVGQWTEDKYRPLVVAMINLGCNLLLVNIIGLEGIVISTIISDLINIPWLLYSVHKCYFNQSFLKDILILFRTIFLGVLISALCFLLCEYILPFSGYIDIIIRLVLCLIVPNILLFVLFFKSDIKRDSFALFKRLLKGK